MEMEIGEAAGRLWQALYEHGELSKSRLAKITGLSAEMVNQALGWLAREGKIACTKKKRSQLIQLKE